MWLLCIDGVDIDVDLHGRLCFNFPAVLRADVLLFAEEHKCFSTAGMFTLTEGDGQNNYRSSLYWDVVCSCVCVCGGGIYLLIQ